MRTFIAALALLAPVTLTVSAHAGVVADWNSIAIKATKDQKLGPNPATRVLAITHVAIHDAVEAVLRKYAPYHAKPSVTGSVDLDYVTAVVAHHVLANLLPAQKASLDTALDGFPGPPDTDVRTRSVALAQAVADDILALRDGDGSTAVVTFPGTDAIGSWRPTPPKLLAASDPQWATVKPFVLASPSALRPAAPPAVTSSDYAIVYAEVKSLGAKDSTTRTAEQTTIANFWAQPTHVPFNAIARQLATGRALDLADEARLFALLNLALADSRIAAWDAKYHYGYWRPITAIPADDGNDTTVAQADWQPLLETPNHPEYPSGHSTTGGAGAGVLRALFGDDVAFNVASDTLAEVTRAYASITQAEIENGRSRIYGGIHFQTANVAGQNLGEAIAKQVVTTQLLPVKPTPTVDAGVDAAKEDDAAVDSAIADTSALEPDTSVVDATFDAASIQPAADVSPPSDSGCSTSARTNGASLPWIVTLASLAMTRRKLAIGATRA